MSQGNTFSVTFTAIDLFGTGAPVSGVTITTSQGSATTSTSGTATVTLSSGSPTITVSGAGYATATYTITNSTSTMNLFLAPTLGADELKVAAVWRDGVAYDLDLNMFGPGDTVFYDANTVGVVNWEYVDKRDALPFAQWTERTNGYGAETIEIKNLSRSNSYEFMMFDWSRVGGDDPSSGFGRVGAQVYVWGGSATGITNTLFTAAPPTPPSGTAYVFWQPFILQSTGSTTPHTLRVVNSYEPAVSLTSIDNGSTLTYSCSYSYCPYTIPGI